MGGAKLLTENPIGVGSSVTIRIGDPPNAPSIEAKARVIWCESVRSELDAYHVGVAFHGLGWRQRFRLKKVIKHHLNLGPKNI
ncbi:PilZ domain-containing protein [candidate division NPL-UPA2 bacterium]|nr:PilZ domain-containing protein [candidate division NPL-UPA2 bacterium]